MSDADGITVSEIDVTKPSYYGVLADFTGEWARTMIAGRDPSRFTGEDLAAKLIFPDRTIRVHWDGSIEVEPKESADGNS